MAWSDFNCMEGEGSVSGEWKILRRRGDQIFNVFCDGKVVALAFDNLTSAKFYVIARLKGGKG